MLGLAVWSALLSLPVIFLVFYGVQRSRQKKFPSWKEIDPAILKVGGSKKKLQEVSNAGIDVIVIGSGLGALTSAAILSKTGYRVVVLEQHDIAGGSTHTFEDGGFEFDVGFHYIGGRLLDWLSPLRRLWSVVSDGQLQWTETDPEYDVCHNSSTGESIPMSKDFRVNDCAILGAFKGKTGAKAALRSYRWMELAGVTAGFVLFALKAFPPAVTRLLWPLFAPLWRRFGGRAVIDVLRECGMVGELQGMGGVMTYCYGDYGVNPNRAPWYLHALVATHYEGGAFFPTGGSSSIAKTVVAGIQRRGGSVFVRAPVSEILVEGGRAVGVRCREVEMKARIVISDAGFRNTFGCSDADETAAADAPRAATTPQGPLLPAKHGAYQRGLLQKDAGGEGGGGEGNKKDAVGGSLAMAYLFVGLDKSDEELGIRAQNIWALKDYDHDAAFARFDKLDFPASEVPAIDDLPAVFLGSASAKDGDWSRRHPGKAAMTVLCPVRAEWFQAWAGGKIKHRGEEYRRVKAAWTELLLESMYKHWPMTKGHVTYTDLGTPLSNDFYLASVKGEVYGLENTAERYNSADALVALHPQTQIPGLYLTGQDTLNVGVVSALVSGVFTAVRISYGAALLCLLECVIA